MKGVAKVAGGRASPGMRYKNVDVAIDFLCRAFGFELRSAEADANGKTSYAELSFGDTIIMIGAVSGFDMDRFMTQPGDIGGAETQCCYYVVNDIDAQYARARSAGCQIVIDMQTRPNGARAFTCRDAEDHLWCFGTYDPWAALSVVPDDRPVPAPEPATHRHAPRFSARLAAGLTMAVIVSGAAAAWIYGEAWQTSREVAAAPSALSGPERVISIELSKETFQSAIKTARRRLAVERRVRRAAERASKAAQAEAAEERSLRIAAEQTAKELADQLAHAQEAADQAKSAADKAQSAASAAQTELAKERDAGNADERGRLAHELEQAQQTAADARKQLDRAKQAQTAAEKDAKETRARLTFVSHSAKESSEQAIAKIREQLKDETFAREAAEHEAETARDELARERQLKAAAWRTVEQLKRRLAAAGVQASTGQSQLKKAVAKRKRAKAAAQGTSTPANAGSTPTVGKGWSLYTGPVFAKEGGPP